MREEEENEQPAEIDRRRLLTGAGLTLGATGAAAAIPLSDAAAASAARAPQDKGYRESEEVKTYYRLACN